MGSARAAGHERRRATSAGRATAAMTLAALSVLAVAAPCARAVIVLRDPGRNLSAPEGDLAGSGWQWQGDWHRFPATVIGPHHFLAATHTGGIPLQPFRFRGRDYLTLERTAIPGTDLSVWRVAGTFPDWAPLYDGAGENDQEIVLFGRGGARGVPLVSKGGKLRHGWRWGPTDGRLSWGRGRVSMVTEPDSPRAPGMRYGALLSWRFSPEESGAGPDTAAVSGGDSGGGVFLRDPSDGGAWKLAGVVYGVDRSYAEKPGAARPAEGTGLAAALYDARGLYRALGGVEFFIPPGSDDPMPTTCLASRVSPYVPAIRAAVARPSPWPAIAGAGLVGIGAGGFAGAATLRRRRRKRRSAARARVAAAVSAAGTSP